MMPDIDYSTYRLMPLTARSRLDPRDYRFRLARAVDVLAEIQAGTLPASVDLHAKGLMPDPWDQGPEGSCTGHAEAAAMAHGYLRAGVTLPTRPSPRYIYWRERLIEGDTDQDNGAEPRDGWDQLVKVGTCLEADCPYDAGDYAQPPSAQADTDAAQYRAARYEAPVDWSECALALAQDRRFVVVAGYWYNEWYNPSQGLMPLVAPNSQPVGAHCYGYCGYRTGLYNGALNLQFKLHNSWGGAWGDGTGHAWIDYTQVDPHLFERWLLYAAVEQQPQPQPNPKPQPDPQVMAGLSWQQSDINWTLTAYANGDVAGAAQQQQTLGAYATALGNYLAGAGAKPAALPAVPGSV